MTRKPVLILAALLFASTSTYNFSALAAQVGESANAVVAPTITTEPANTTVELGNFASFYVVAAGTQPLTYAWYKNGILIPNSNSPGYSFQVAQTDNGSYFTVKISNSAGSITSNRATLTVVHQPVILQQPQSLVVTAPGIASFTVYPAYSANQTVQWYKNGIAIPGATQWEYDTAETTTADNGAYFQVVVKDTLGSTTSNKAILTVKAFAGTGTFPIVGEWSGTAIIKATGSSNYTAQAVAAFSQTSYALIGTMVYTDEFGIPLAGATVASLNNLNLFTSPGDSYNLAGGFSANLLTLNFQVAGNDDTLPGGTLTGTGTLTISADHNTLTGSGTDTTGDTVTWKLTRVK